MIYYGKVEKNMKGKLTLYVHKISSFGVFLIVNEANVQEHFPFPVSGQFKSRALKTTMTKLGTYMKLKHATRLELFIGSIKNHDFFQPSLVIFGLVQYDERSIIFRLRHIISSLQLPKS